MDTFVRAIRLRTVRSARENAINIFGSNTVVGRKTAKVKVCGITTQEDMELCVRCGADALGFLVHRGEQISGPPGHRLDLLTANRLIAAVPPHVATVLLVHVSTSDAIAELCDHIKPSTLQIQTAVPERDLACIKRQFPQIAIVKTVHIYPESSVDEVVSVTERHLDSGSIDAINLDSRKSKASTQTGGTGLTHDWNVSASVVKRFGSIPVMLAGGLNHKNVRRAVETVRPYAVDVMTGVEWRRGIKSEEMLRSFFTALCEN